MFFMEPNRTPYDLNFRLGDVPVRIHPLFWLMTIILGWDLVQSNPREDIGVRLGFLLVWVACVFVSILIHELGHILMGRAFGNYGHIVLYSFGGLAVGSNAQRARWQRIAVSFAGPLAGFVLFGITIAVALFLLKPWLVALPGGWLLPYDFLPHQPGLTARYLASAANDLLWINLFWGLLNLLPIWPLDGGQISREVCTGLAPRGGVRISLGISVLVAGLLAVNSLSMHFRSKPLIPYLTVGDLYMALFFGLLAIGSFMQMQQTGQQPARRQWDRDEEERSPWERDPDYWKKGRDPWND